MLEEMRPEIAADADKSRPAPCGGSRGSVFGALPVSSGQRKHDSIMVTPERTGQKGLPYIRLFT